MRLFLILIVSIISLAGCSFFNEKDVDSTKIEVNDKQEVREATLSYLQAKAIAEQSNCVDEGNLKEDYVYNEVTHTWWLDMNADKPGCNPACVVDEKSQAATINWRCTGLIEEKMEDELEDHVEDVSDEDFSYIEFYENLQEVLAIEKPTKIFKSENINWNLTENNSIEEIVFRGKTLSLSNLEKAQNNAIQPFFEARGFKEAKNNVTGGTLSWRIGYIKGKMVCVAESMRSSEDTYDASVSCGELN